MYSHVSVCAFLSVDAMDECVKAVREHQVPKIDTAHGKERGKERERDCRVGIHIYETKSPHSRTVTMINYRLQITVNTHFQQHTHVNRYTHTLTNTMPCRISEKPFLMVR